MSIVRPVTFFAALLLAAACSETDTSISEPKPQQSLQENLNAPVGQLDNSVVPRAEPGTGRRDQ